MATTKKATKKATKPATPKKKVAPKKAVTAKKPVQAAKPTVKRPNMRTPVLQAFVKMISNKIGVGDVLGIVTKKYQRDNLAIDFTTKDIKDAIDILVKENKIKVFKENFFYL